jgi:itaconyl-CoA hydratase
LCGENSSPIQFDHHYTSRTEFRMPLVDPTFTLTLVTGPSVTDASQNDFAYLGWGEVGLLNPVFEGDPTYSRSEVLEKRESKSRPDVGIGQVETTGFN